MDKTFLTQVALERYPVNIFGGTVYVREMSAHERFEMVKLSKPGDPDAAAKATRWILRHFVVDEDGKAILNDKDVDTVLKSRKPAELDEITSFFMQVNGLSVKLAHPCPHCQESIDVSKFNKDAQQAAKDDSTVEDAKKN
jgi:hypothetical protein